MQSSASGVILTDDGYIVTNNHVVQDADDIEVVLHDQRSYKAKVIGTDPTTDLALIKIDGVTVETSPQLQEIIAEHHPGEMLTVTLIRNGVEKQFTVTLH